MKLSEFYHYKEQLFRCMRFMFKHVLGIIFCFVLSMPAWAETYYVDDTLRVGVRAKPIKSLPSLTVIKSGAAIELLAQKGGYSKIRTNNGIEGWVKSAYISDKPPAIAKLKRLQGDVEHLKSEINTLKNQQTTEQSLKTKSMQEKIAQLQEEKISLQNQLANASISNPAIVSQQTTPNHGPLPINLKNIDKQFLYFFIGGIVVLLSMGFLFGVSWHKKQVTKRLGGLSI